MKSHAFGEKAPQCNELMHRSGLARSHEVWPEGLAEHENGRPDGHGNNGPMVLLQKVLVQGLDAGL